MKLIFLDFDGVLNDVLWRGIAPHQKGIEQYEITDPEFDAYYINPASVLALNQIVKETGAKIVYSTSWRRRRTQEQLDWILREKGFQGESIGCLPLSETVGLTYRSEVIDKYLEDFEEGEVEAYIVLDDDSYPIKDRLVLTHAYDGGLTLNKMREAIDKLGGQS